MALPKVFSFLSGKEAPQPENFLAVKIDSGNITATSWSVKDGKVELGKVASGNRASESEDDLVKSADEAVSAVGEGLVPEPKSVIFGVWEDWVEAGKIKHAHLVKLRKLCKELELSPMGFVTISESVDNFLKEVEGVPLTAILVGIDVGRLSVTMLRAGKNFGTHSVEFEDNIGMSLEKAIRQFTQVEFLPSRIIIYDGKKDLEAWKEKIVAYPWTQRLPFLHFPKVEVLPDEEVVRAVAGAGGTQLGGTLDLGAISWQPDPASAEAGPMASQPTKVGARDQQAAEATILAGEEVEEVAPEEMGFAMERPESELKDMPSQEVFKPAMLRNGPVPKHSGLGVLSGVVSLLSAIRLPEFKLPGKPATPGQSGSNKRLPVIVGAVLLIIIVLAGGSGSYYFLSSAQVTVFVKAQPVNRTMDIFVSLDETRESTAGAKVVGKVVETNLSGSKKGVASGKKLVGDKAQGTIKIYSVTSGKTFAAGTSLTGTDNLKFTLDKEVSVASGDAVTPATVDATVTAAEIGDKYNLAADTRFTVGSFSKEQYLAQNGAVFSGGNSHQATIVTKQDQDRLVATISAELESRAREELRKEIGPGDTLLDKAITSKIDAKRFSKNIDDEADNLTTDLTMKFSGVVFDENNAKRAFKESVALEIPSGYELSLSNINSELVKVTPLRGGDFILNFSFSGRAIPVLSTNDLVKKIVGQGIDRASSLVKDQTGVEEVEIVIEPPLFTSLSRLPFRESQIKIDQILQ